MAMNTRDNRRILGPEKSTPLYLLKPYHKKPVLSNGKRQDGRSLEEVRKMFFGLSNVSQAKGSSYVEVGTTKIVCGVYGPREILSGNVFLSSGQVNCDIRMAPFSCSIRSSPVPDSQVRELSSHVREALQSTVMLEHYPKSEISVYITVVENGGGLLAACLNAASLALCDAGIYMYDVIAAASFAWCSGSFYYDPTIAEERFIVDVDQQLAIAKDALQQRDQSSEEPATDNNENGVSSVSNGLLTVGLMPSYANGQVASMVMSGSVDAELLVDGLNFALEVCRKVYTVMMQVLLENGKESTHDSPENKHGEVL